MGALSDAYGMYEDRKKDTKSRGANNNAGAAGSSGDPDPVTTYAKQRGSTGRDDGGVIGAIEGAARATKRALSKQRS